MSDPARADAPGDAGEALVTCELQGGTLSVFADEVHIERSSRSMFEDKSIPMAEIEGVEFTAGIMNGHIQVRQAGADLDSGGFLTHPVDENTLYFRRGRAACAEEARDEILARIEG